MSVKSHPPGLYVLFFTEAWERFSYYGMRALLTLYLVNHLKYSRADALEVYAIYTGLVYLTPLLGGYLADRVLGARKAIFIGGIVMALGHLAMAFEPLLNTALGLLIIGNGFFKPNISTLVGGLYGADDPRRDGGFTIFYMGINLGAFFSPLVCGTLGEMIGWHYGFSAAGIGMVAGLLVFLGGQRIIGEAGFPPLPAGSAEASPAGGRRLTGRDWRDIIACVLACVAFVGIFLRAWGAAGHYWTALGWHYKTALVLAAIFLLHRSSKFFAPAQAAAGTGAAGDAAAAAEDALGRDDYERIAVICILAVFVIFFWMGFEQAGGTMTLFADNQTDRHLLGYEIPASFFQSINPLLIMALAPIFSIFWTWLAESRYSISTPTKMALGLIILGIGFVVMYVGQKIAVTGDHTEVRPFLFTNGYAVWTRDVEVFVYGQVGPLWLTAVYFFHTVAELCLSPIGLSMVTKLAPTTMVSLFMGVWFLSTALANYLAGKLEALVELYHLPLYGFLIASSIGAGFALLCIVPVLKKWTHGRA